jgi:NAD(P)-dependent dehydrogenase (short-subunit alcohol dehydrogenase family)
MTTEALALVTGATRGIGLAVCETLIASGRKVVATGRDARRLSELRARHGERVVTLEADLSLPGAWSELVARAERVGPVRELVCNAGVVRYAVVGHVSEEELRDQLELDFVVPYLMSQQLGSAMRARGGGSIVHVVSTLGLRPAPETSAYAASKAALIAATRAFALELAPEVRVNAVAPGIVDTDMVRVLRRAPQDGESQPEAVARQLEGFSRLHPLGRLGTPAEIARAVSYLLDAQWVTGTVLTVDGGISL